MENILKKYNEWLNNKEIDDGTKIEIMNMSQNEIEDSFHKDLDFGTAGIRGKLGLGPNRINTYTVGKAIQGLANIICKEGDKAKNRGVSIGYDVRHRSEEFAKLAGEILTGNGIKVFLYDSIRSTPMVSFTIRELNNISGIMITASHNPKDYNGLKIYWENGSQILDELADEISKEIKAINSFDEIKTLELEEAKEKGLLEIIGKDLDEKYEKKVLGLAINDEEIDKEIKICYTPLYGTGYKPVKSILKERGFKNLFIVEEQKNPDSNFTTVGYPNPEYLEAFEYSIRLGKRTDADILIATDPDADRVAAMVKDGSDYRYINGNQMGILLVYYILSERHKQNRLPKNSSLVKSIVTGNLSEKIGNTYGVKTFETLTGFKNICGKANEFEKTGEYEFIFGYEESIGYVYSDMVRDKDAISTTMLICEMAAYYKRKNKNLIDVLGDIFKEYGYYLDNLFSIDLKGIDGLSRTKRIMKDFRKNPIERFEGMNLEKTIDYLEDETGNPKSNVLKYILDEGSWYAIRPSGTEPKLKIYIYSNDREKDKALLKINNMKKGIVDKIDKID